MQKKRITKYSPYSYDEIIVDMRGHNIYYELHIHAFLKLEETYIDQGEDGDLECLVHCCYCCCYYYYY